MDSGRCEWDSLKGLRRLLKFNSNCSRARFAAIYFINVLHLLADRERERENERENKSEELDLFAGERDKNEMNKKVSLRERKRDTENKRERAIFTMLF